MEKALKTKGLDGAASVFRTLENKTVDMKRVRSSPSLNLLALAFLV